MTQMVTYGHHYLAALLAEGKPSTLLKGGAIDHLFLPNEIMAYAFVKDFVEQYHQLPSPDTIFAHLAIELPETVEPSAYYHDIMVDRHTEMELKRAMKLAAEQLSGDTKNIQGAFEILNETATELMVRRNPLVISDFRDAYDSLVGAYTSVWNEDVSKGVMLGWPTLDDLTGGLQQGDLLSIVGRPEKGKSMLMVHAAHHAWLQGRHVLFLSMEMRPLLVQQRLAALHTHLPMTWVKNATLPTKGLQRYKEGLAEAQASESSFWVVDGNMAATVDDVWAIASQLKPDLIAVDGGYLLKHPTERDRYRRVAENADLIKHRLCALAPVVASWQFARPPGKTVKKIGPAAVATLDDIGYTDAIGQVSSIVLGVFEEASIETVHQRRIEILKGRSGESGRFFTHWDWWKMDFSEVPEVALSELQF
jgi:hypothetical protein